MLSEKPWKPEAVLRLMMTLFVSFLTGALLCAVVALAGEQGWISPTVDRKFISFIIAALSFQGAALIGLVYFLRGHGIGWGEAFGVSKPDTFSAVSWGVLAILFVLPVAFLLSNLSVKLLHGIGIAAEPQTAVKMLQTAMPIGQTIVYGFFAIILAPVAEELIFRGVLYPTFKQNGYPRLAIWATAILFAATHVNMMAFIPLTFLALVLTALYEKTENLIAPIVTHSLFNAVNFYLIVAPADWKPKWFVQ